MCCSGLDVGGYYLHLDDRRSKDPGKDKLEYMALCQMEEGSILDSDTVFCL